MFNIIFIVNAVSIRNKNIENSGSVSDEPKSNPWQNRAFAKPYFEFPPSHSSGVYNDLGRNVDSYRVPAGKCPVIGKVLLLKNNFNLNTTSIPEGFSVDNLMESLKSGNLPGGKNANGLVLPVEELKKLNAKYPTLKAVEKAEDVEECVNYAKKFSHSTNLNTCEENKTCLKHPFIYDFMDKLCYVLFPLRQEYRVFGDDREFIYRPYKSMYTNFFIFGTTDIPSNWSPMCPKLSVKGAAFGVWKNGECSKIEGLKKNINFNDCVKLLFALSPNGGNELSQNNGINYANWHNNTCEIIKEQPNCFYHGRYSYAITSVGLNHLALHEVVPCDEVSNNWTVDISCENGLELFTCNGKNWTNTKNYKINGCSDYSFQQFNTSSEQLRIKDNKFIVPKLLQEDIAAKSFPTETISKTTKSGGVKSWKNGGIISSIFFLIICFAL